MQIRSQIRIQIQYYFSNNYPIMFHSRVTMLIGLLPVVVEGKGTCTESPSCTNRVPCILPNQQ
jgi:hypothetical protein